MDIEDDINLFEPELEPGNEGGEPAPQPEYVSKADYDKLLGDLNSLKDQTASAVQFKNDMAKMFNPQSQEPANDYITQFAQRPDEFVSNIENRVYSRVREEQDAKELVREYEQKNPDLVQYKPYVSMEYQMLMNEYQQQGKALPGNRELLEESINRFRTKFNIGVEQHQTDQRVKEVKRQAMSLQTNGSPNAPKKSRVEEIWAMPIDQFEAELNRKARQGIVT